jgi:hypothetical protein
MKRRAASPPLATEDEQSFYCRRERSGAGTLNRTLSLLRQGATAIFPVARLPSTGPPPGEQWGLGEALQCLVCGVKAWRRSRGPAPRRTPCVVHVPRPARSHTRCPQACAISAPPRAPRSAGRSVQLHPADSVTRPCARTTRGGACCARGRTAPAARCASRRSARPPSRRPPALPSRRWSWCSSLRCSASPVTVT